MRPVCATEAGVCGSLAVERRVSTRLLIATSNAASRFGGGLRPYPCTNFAMRSMPLLMLSMLVA